MQALRPAISRLSPIPHWWLCPCADRKEGWRSDSVAPSHKEEKREREIQARPAILHDGKTQDPTDMTRISNTGQRKGRRSGAQRNRLQGFPHKSSTGCSSPCFPSSILISAGINLQKIKSDSGQYHSCIFCCAPSLPLSAVFESCVLNSSRDPSRHQSYWGLSEWLPWKYSSALKAIRVFRVCPKNLLISA